MIGPATGGNESPLTRVAQPSKNLVSYREDEYEGSLLVIGRLVLNISRAPALLNEPLPALHTLLMTDGLGMLFVELYDAVSLRFAVAIRRFNEAHDMQALQLNNVFRHRERLGYLQTIDDEDRDVMIAEAQRRLSVAEQRYFYTGRYLYPRMRARMNRLATLKHGYAILLIVIAKLTKDLSPSEPAIA